MCVPIIKFVCLNLWLGKLCTDDDTKLVLNVSSDFIFRLGLFYNAFHAF